MQRICNDSRQLSFGLWGQPELSFVGLDIAGRYHLAFEVADAGSDAPSQSQRALNQLE